VLQVPISQNKAFSSGFAAQSAAWYVLQDSCCSFYLESDCSLKTASIFEARCALHRVLSRTTIKADENEGKLEGSVQPMHYVRERVDELICVEFPI